MSGNLSQNNVVERLKQLRQRLIAANLGNRSVRLSRLSMSATFDLARLERLNARSLKSLVTAMGEEGPATIPLVSAKASSRSKGEAAENLRRLANAAHQTWMDVGESELAVGWPIIEGKLDDAWVRAPLLLYPAELKRSPSGKITWELTLGGRPVINEVLTQTIYRLVGLRLDLDALLNLDDDKLLKPDDGTWWAICNWLAQGGIQLANAAEIDAALPALSLAVPQISKDERESAEPGRLELHHQLILGRFPQASSNVLVEYNELEHRPELLLSGPAGRLLAVDGRPDTWLTRGIGTVGGSEAPRARAKRSDPSSPSKGSGGWSKEGRSARILASDASQEDVLALLEQPSCEGVVVRGPPGTGKSQLIANLIGQAIDQNRSVLMVCQKRAALDVVAHRLGSVGLSEPLAVVHDVHRDRQAFCASVAQSLDDAFSVQGGEAAQRSTRAGSAAIRKYHAAQRRLGIRLEAANQAYDHMMERGPGGVRLAELFERALDDEGRPLPDLTSVAAECTEADYDAHLPELEAVVFDALPFAAPHPLWPRTHWEHISDDAVERLQRNLLSFREALESCIPGEHATMTPADAGTSAELWGRCADVLRLLSGPDREARQAFALFWVFTGAGKDHRRFDQIVELLETAKKEMSSVPAALFAVDSKQLSEWLGQLETGNRLRTRWWRPFSPTFWRLRKLPAVVLEAAQHQRKKGEQIDLVRMVQMCLGWQELTRSIQTLCEGALFWEFGCRGQIEDIELALEELAEQQRMVDQVRQVHRALGSSHWAYRSVPSFDGTVDATEEPFVQAAVSDFLLWEGLEETHAEAQRLGRYIREDWLAGIVDGAERAKPALTEVDRVLDALRSPELVEGVSALDHHLASLPPWAVEFLRFYRPVPFEKESKIAFVDLGLDQLAVDARTALERAWRTIALGGRPAHLHEAPLVDASHRGALSEAYHESCRLAGAAVVARYRQELREAAQNEGRAQSLRMLLSDAKKRRYRRSIRQIVKRYWDVGLSTLRPVWLCSPDSVAALFPLEQHLFDLVVIDEASQCPVESALPAVIRGRRVLIAGDEKQMPPSHFFVHREDDELDGRLDQDDDDDQSALLAAESILDVGRVAYPAVMLQWHYRSRHEELITFSNHAFYNGDLVTAPPALRARKSFEGMRFVQVSGVWQGQTNPIEAERTVDLVLELLATRLDDGRPPSLGIVTFNRKQRALIQRVLDQRAGADERAGQLLQEQWSRAPTEALFVKNLENVQGDERDIIIFSVGYGPNVRGGPIFARFGPVGQERGENRLNVAITRAKLGVIVVASFHAHALDVSSTKHIGPKLLKRYLSYVELQEKGDRAAIDSILAEVCSLVADDEGSRAAVRRGSIAEPVGHRVRTRLADALEARGLIVERDFGIGPYRLDLAVRHPQNDRRWTCGVDCTRFLSTPHALRRDVTEPAFWQRAGWSIVRVSPAQILNDHDAVVERIVKIASA